MTPTQLLLIVFALINLYTTFVMAYDKHKAVRSHGHQRTSEGYIFFLASMFGSIGVYIGMNIFRHKTRKWYFQLGIPMLILQNLALLYVINLFI